MPKPGPDKALCGAVLKKRGKTCGFVAGHGTPHLGTGRCYRHGGLTPTHLVSAREKQARAACEKLGIMIQTEPGVALLEEVWLAKGAAAYYGALVEQLAKVPIAPSVEEITGGPQDGEKRLVPGTEAVYMPTYHASGMPTGRAQPHVLVRLWMEERKRAAEADAMAVKLGLVQRMIDQATEDAQRIAKAMVAYAVAMGHDPESSEVRQALDDALRSVAASSSTTATDSTALEITP